VCARAVCGERWRVDADGSGSAFLASPRVGGGSATGVPTFPRGSLCAVHRGVAPSTAGLSISSLTDAAEAPLCEAGVPVRGQAPARSSSMILEVAERTRAVPTIGASAVRTW